MDQLRGAVRTLALVARSLERAAGDLTLPQYRVLLLVAGGDRRASRLAGRLAVAKPTVTAVVDGLVERGLVVREPEPEDRRATRLVITRAGRRALERAERAMTRRLAQLAPTTPACRALAAALAGVDQVLDAERAARLAADGPGRAGT